MLRWLLRITAIYLGVLGTAALLVPQAAASGLGQPLTPFDVFATRTIGAILLTVAILNWSASASTRAPAGAVLANVFLNAALGVVNAIAIVDGTIGAGGWSGVAIHAALVLAFSLCHFLRRPPQLA
ncbi:hypothetical protein ACGFIE_26940 [Micromonospora sp. NPDC049275]|uniref:hypothetical protein n=1 Tax=Micromonospora sp. NPDC049275 TaxID=3364268 RepID=UPI00371952B5